MTATGDDYRLKAKEAEKQSLNSSDLEVKSSYLEIAQQWLLMAEQAEQIEKL